MDWKRDILGFKTSSNNFNIGDHVVIDDLWGYPNIPATIESVYNDTGFIVKLPYGGTVGVQVNKLKPGDSNDKTLPVDFILTFEIPWKAAREFEAGGSVQSTPNLVTPTSEIQIGDDLYEVIDLIPQALKLSGSDNKRLLSILQSLINESGLTVTSKQFGNMFKEAVLDIKGY